MARTTSPVTPTLALAALALLGLNAGPLSAGCCEEGTKELIAEHIQYYGAIGGTDLPGCAETTEYLYVEFGDAGGWKRNWWKNTAAWESDWKRSSISGGQDNVYADARDFGYFCGHGNVGTVFFTTQKTNTTLVPWETGFGDVDLEWVTFDTSMTLQDTGNNLDDWHNHAFTGRLHALIGWHDSPLDGDTGGEFADEMIDHGIFDGGGDYIQVAWFDSDGGCTDQTSWTTQTILYEDGLNLLDQLHGEGTTYPDPPVFDNVYFVSQHDC